MPIRHSIRDYFASMRQHKQDTEFMPEVDGAILEDSPWFTRITVWVVSFGVSLNSSLTSCASPGKAYQANNAAQLNENFQAIARQISKLRLSQ